MAEPTGRPASRQELVAAYKAILRAYIEQRPSGIRLRLANVLGTHKSFISLITNPADPTPVPERHLPAIAELCHLSENEQETLLAAYSVAHPQHARKLRPVETAQARVKALHLTVPVLDDPAQQKEFEDAIREFVRRLASLLASREPRGK